MRAERIGGILRRMEDRDDDGDKYETIYRADSYESERMWMERYVIKLLDINRYRGGLEDAKQNKVDKPVQGDIMLTHRSLPSFSFLFGLPIFPLIDVTSSFHYFSCHNYLHLIFETLICHSRYLPECLLICHYMHSENCSKGD